MLERPSPLAPLWGFVFVFPTRKEFAMGQRGPIPDRSDNLARPRSRKGGDSNEPTKGIAYEATIPEPDPDWHPISLMLWNAMLESGQSEFYQSTDWVMAYSLCEELSLYKNPKVTKDGEEYHKRSGQMLQTINTMMGDLLLTEAHRRRVRIELEKPEEEETPASIVAINDYKAQLGVEE
jgi:hypothetical protein